MRSQVLIFEDSSKVSFGGGQNITLKVAKVLSDNFELVFADFTSESRYFNLVDEQFQFHKKVALKSGITRNFSNRSFQIINEALGFIFYKKKNIQDLIGEINVEECVIYATTRKALIYAKEISKKYNVPYIYHAHLVENKKSFGYWVIKNALLKADRIICVSKVVQSSINLTNTVLLYNPIPTPTFPSIKKEKVNNKFVIASIGSLVPIKGLEYFVKTANLFSKNGNLEFRIYGEGAQKSQLEKISNGRVVMKGFCSEIVKELKEEIDIIVLPSVIAEALPTVIIEAKSVGIPIITTNIGGQAEIIQDAIDGFLVPVRNENEIYKKLNKLISDLQLYREMSKASFLSSDRFSYDVFQKNILYHIMGKK